MIFYFSGTGNSLAIARCLSKALNDDLISMAKPTIHDCLTAKSNKQILGFVFPVYAWGMPAIVEFFLRHTFSSYISLFYDNIQSDKHFKNELKHKGIYFFLILTCGDDTGETHKIFRKALKKIYKLDINAYWSVQMPNTYIAIPGFDTDNAHIIQNKLKNASSAIQHIATAITKRETNICQVCTGTLPYFKSYILRPLFKLFLSSPKGFHIEEKLCIGCRKCALACPLGNILMDEHMKPQWKNNCTICFACYQKCPKHAIRWGIFSNKKKQYSLDQNHFSK